MTMKYDKYDNIIAFALMFNGSDAVSSISPKHSEPEEIIYLFDKFLYLQVDKKYLNPEDIQYYPEVRHYTDKWIGREKLIGMNIVTWIIRCSIPKTSLEDILELFEEYVCDFKNVECTDNLRHYGGYGFSSQLLDSLLKQLNRQHNYQGIKRQLIIRDIIA